jgi:hypothetical protein
MRWLTPETSCGDTASSPPTVLPASSAYQRSP